MSEKELAQLRKPQAINKRGKDLYDEGKRALEEEKATEAAYCFLRSDLHFLTAQLCLRMDMFVAALAVSAEKTKNGLDPSEDPYFQQDAQNYR